MPSYIWTNNTHWTDWNLHHASPSACVECSQPYIVTLWVGIPFHEMPTHSASPYDGKLHPPYFPTKWNDKMHFAWTISWIESLFLVKILGNFNSRKMASIHDMGKFISLGIVTLCSIKSNAQSRFPAHWFTNCLFSPYNTIQQHQWIYPHENLK